VRRLGSQDLPVAAGRVGEVAGGHRVLRGGDPRVVRLFRQLAGLTGRPGRCLPADRLDQCRDELAHLRLG
jgi:hypothetical protein